MRRKEKEITTKEEMITILENATYVTVAMSRNDEPYLVTLSHGYDRNQNCIYFHSAKEGKKIDFLSANNLIWGQALCDKGYVQGACDHLYATTQFKGKVTFVQDFEEKKHALEVMINALDNNPKQVMEKQLDKESVSKVHIGRIDIEYMSGKKSEKVIISL